MIHLISYGDYRFYNRLNVLKIEVQKLNLINSFTAYTEKDIDNTFKKKFGDILKKERGGGYWIWKPYIIKKHIEKINNNDILIYIDAGVTINSRGKNRLLEYINILKESNEGILSFQMEDLKEKFWTKREAFDYFKISYDDDIANSGQLVGGILIMKKNKKLISQIEEWNKVLYDDSSLFVDNFDRKVQIAEFKDHRHDQSIFSIIRKISGSLVIKNETFFNFGSKISIDFPFWATGLRY